MQGVARGASRSPGGGSRQAAKFTFRIVLRSPLTGAPTYSSWKPLASPRAVGNLVRITRETGLSQTTTITATSAASGTQGTTVPLTVTGANLAGASVVCTTPGVSVQQVRTDLDQLTLALVLGASAPLGPVACEVRGLDVVALAFTVVEPPPPVFVAGSAVSVALAPLPENANGAVTGAVSVAVGSGGGTLQAGPGGGRGLRPALSTPPP